MAPLGWLRRWLGDEGERLAARHLRTKGYRILVRQARNRFGEIDLVALDGETIVFVEVKSLRQSRGGAPSERVDAGKQARLTRAALTWLKRRGLLDRRSRFDVVEVSWDASGKPEARLLANAFEPTEFGQMY
jgi:putative endonuclease